MNDDFRSLAARCLAGDQAAMIDLVERFQGQVFGLCYRMLGQRQDAEEMTQETFHRALRNLKSWDPTRDFEPWLLAIAGNRCRTLLAQRGRRPAVQSLADDPSRDDERQSQAGADLAEEVTKALLEIRDEYRQAFVLFHERELGYAEIAAAMEVPLGTIKTWVHRARQELISRLRERGVLAGELAEADHALRRV